MKRIERMKILKNRPIASRIYELELEGDLVKEMKSPGQFVHLKAADGLDTTLRRPISICHIDREAGTFTMLYRTEGKGTQLLSRRQAGERLDVLGPLGTGFPVEGFSHQTRCLLIGGGIGVPPLYELARQLTARGHKVTTVIGFRSAEDVFYEDAFRELGYVYVATEDGSRGTKGFVTDVIDRHISEWDRYFTCGPRPMLRAVEARLGPDGWVSLEERMGCGVGACLACVCDEKNGSGYRKVCTDGPVFRAEEVVV
ncbi:dihydroorotate dehydrogenase electron transfer subunit [Alteribacter natronophilus]|uniref:dihydroorotate dehydrogenase electron transfer subunit n=1 Tax=Alteribacter natronophilus TaxID=2583810 RepID=UPI00110D686B|nr:dihydroorotate dehydrogenase electron transfer subunit [Alteribacter natronophilus]TMW73151.1 dihydroorotate dehydrogenase electron transfer subunit [Alteribacter natronophilus]